MTPAHERHLPAVAVSRCSPLAAVWQRNVWHSRAIGLQNRTARFFESLTSKENARSALQSGLRVVTRRPCKLQSLIDSGFMRSSVEAAGIEPVRSVPQPVTAQGLRAPSGVPSAPGQQSRGSDRPGMSPNDEALRRVIEAWARLPTHIKSSIEHMCRNSS